MLFSPPALTEAPSASLRRNPRRRVRRAASGHALPLPLRAKQILVFRKIDAVHWLLRSSRAAVSLLPFLFNSSHSVESLRRCRRPALLSLLLSYNSSTLPCARRRPPVPPSAAFATGFPRTTPCPSPSHPTQESTRPQEPRALSAAALLKTKGLSSAHARAPGTEGERMAPDTGSYKQTTGGVALRSEGRHLATRTVPTYHRLACHSLAPRQYDMILQPGRTSVEQPISMKRRIEDIRRSSPEGEIRWAYPSARVLPCDQSARSLRGSRRRSPAHLTSPAQTRSANPAVSRWRSLCPRAIALKTIARGSKADQLVAVCRSLGGDLVGSGRGQRHPSSGLAPTQRYGWQRLQATCGTGRRRRCYFHFYDFPKKGHLPLKYSCIMQEDPRDQFDRDIAQARSLCSAFAGASPGGLE
ncbi:hypothetical protein C7M84_018196 [Penaeus vannamei]|uniref:Uncharacterized protein n=1 Tax=Penaeus vannamei TaxID=6689 RepID=A0A423SI46_PENVA|nr:hypothetical protein C7M84_018196 [Penaeus vannamei]